MEFPVKRTFGYLEDPELYFGLLPRDIQRYCLQPLLIFPYCSTICGERWADLSGEVTNHLSLNTYWAMDLVFLSNGYLFMLVGTQMIECYQLIPGLRLNTFNLKCIYHAHLPLTYTKIQYDRTTDDLYLLTDNPVTTRIRQISQVETNATFLLRCKDKLRPSPPLDNLFTLDSSTTHVYRGSELVYSAAPGKKIDCLDYYGGYLLLGSHKQAEYSYTYGHGYLSELRLLRYLA